MGVPCRFFECGPVFVPHRYRSVSVSSSVVLGDSLNNFVQPAKPQTLEDVFNGPYFVQKVSLTVQKLLKERSF